MGAQIRRTGILMNWDSNIKLLADNLDLGIKRDFVSDGYRVLFVAQATLCITP